MTGSCTGRWFTALTGSSSRWKSTSITACPGGVVYKFRRRFAREKKLGIWQCPGYVTDEGFNKDKWCKDGAEKKPDAGYTGPYNPKGPDRDCSDFATRAEAQAFY
jgi:hypothetical protein